MDTFWIVREMCMENDKRWMGSQPTQLVCVDEISLHELQ